MKEPEISITIRMGNDAFQDGNRASEVARILRELAKRIDAGGQPMILYDVNGQRVGEMYGNFLS